MLRRDKNLWRQEADALTSCLGSLLGPEAHEYVRDLQPQFQPVCPQTCILSTEWQKHTWFRETSVLEKLVVVWKIMELKVGKDTTIWAWQGGAVSRISLSIHLVRQEDLAGKQHRFTHRCTTVSLLWQLIVQMWVKYNKDSGVKTV